MQHFPDKALQLVEAGAPGCTPGQHSAILQRLWASVQEGRELVCLLVEVGHSEPGACVSQLCNARVSSW